MAFFSNWPLGKLSDLRVGKNTLFAADTLSIFPISDVTKILRLIQETCLDRSSAFQ